MNEAIIIPVLDPEPGIIDLVDGLHGEGFTRIVVVDDGSCAEKAPLFESLVRRGAHVLRHPQNRGKGAALKTGIAYALKAFPGVPAFVTVDGDGQHLPADVARVCAAVPEDTRSLMLGTRDFSSPGVPLRSRLGNRFSAAFFRIDTGVVCGDTQTGLRRIPACLAEQAVACPGNRYDYEMNFLTSVAKNGMPIGYVPIRTVYSEGNGTSHFRPVRDSLMIYGQFVKFALSSLSCSLADLVLFALLAMLVPLQGSALVAVSTAVARICSGCLNFIVNRQVSFSARGRPIGRQALRYGILFVGQMVASMLLVTLLSGTGLPLVVAKVIVDTGMFFVSYFIQRNWVFKKESAATEVAAARGVHAMDRKVGEGRRTVLDGRTDGSGVPSAKRSRWSGVMPKVCAAALTGFTVFVLMDAFVIARVQGEVQTADFAQVALAASAQSGEEATPSASNTAAPSGASTQSTDEGASGEASVQDSTDETNNAGSASSASSSKPGATESEAQSSSSGSSKERPSRSGNHAGPGKRSRSVTSSETGSTTQQTQETATADTAAVEEESVDLSTASSTDMSYEDENIKVSISTVRAYDTDIYIADVQVSSAEYLKTALAQNAFGRNLKESTSDMAEENGAILAINGDYYGFRDDGYVLRNGVLYRDDAASNTDALVVYADGTLAAADQDSVTAQELSESGAWQVLSFGPVLIQDGEVEVDTNDEVDQARASNPRTAIGMIDPLHYIVVVSDGRTDASEGLTLYQLAQVMKEAGADFAYNLDGGGSSTMWFKGQTVNNPTSGHSNGEREVSDIVYFG